MGWNALLAGALSVATYASGGIWSSGFCAGISLCMACVALAEKIRIRT